MADKHGKQRDRTVDVINLDALSGNAMVNRRQVLASALPVSTVTLWRYVRSGKFPQPSYPNGGRIAMWRVETVRAWLAVNGSQEKAA